MPIAAHEPRCANTEPVNCTASELSTFLRALEAGFLPTFYLDISPFALSSSIRIASKSWRNGKRTGCFPGFQSLPMSASSTASPGADSLMSSQADSPARTSASPAKAQESTASDPAYGVKWRGSLARFDPVSRSWKTAQHSLIEDSDECSVTWPRSGMTVDGQCYLLPMLGRRTVASASGLSPDGVTAFHTPNTTGLDGGSNSRAALKARRLWQTPVSDDSVNRAQGKFNSRGEPKLSAQVLWPTPHGFSPDGRSNGPSGNEIGRAVNQSLAWPTPTVNGNYNKQGLSAKSGDGLATAVWRTPSASVIDAKSTVVKLTGRKPSDPQVGLADQVRAGDPSAGGSLSPDWVELLMGWPKGWTSLEPIESPEIRGWGEGWEGDTPRVEVGTPNRVSRLKAIGNGQVPQCAAEAWRLLTCA